MQSTFEKCSFEFPGKKAMEHLSYLQEEETMMPPPPAELQQEMLYWDYPTHHLGLVSSVFDPSPPPSEPPFTSEEEMLCWDAFLPPLGESTVFDPLPPPPVPVIPRSAFVRYQRPYYHLGNNSASAEGKNKMNVHMRMVEFLRWIPAPEKKPAAAVEGSRCFRHMMRERQRRERLSQTYSDLHSMIVPRPKADKNSIVLSAAAYARELKGVEESLRRRREELMASVARGDGWRSSEVTKINLRVGKPSSPMDSMIGALRRLKAMDVKAKSIRSSLRSGDLSAVVEVGTKMATAEKVERAVQEALLEVEWKFRRRNPPLPGSSTNAEMF